MANLDEFGRKFNFNPQETITGNKDSFEPLPTEPSVYLAPTRFEQEVSGPEAQDRYAAEKTRAFLEKLKMDAEDKQAVGSAPVPVAKQPDITPAPVRQADAKAGVTVQKETEPAAPKMGAGGDEGPDRLAVAEALSRGLGAFHEGVTGQKLQNSIPEMLATLRQRREAQALKEKEIGLEEAKQSRAEALKRWEVTQQADNERQANAAYTNALKKAYPDEAAAGVFDELDNATGKPQFAGIARMLEAKMKGEKERPKIEAQTETEKKKPAQIEAKTRQANATADRMAFLSSPAGIAAARKNAEKQDQAFDKALGGRFSGLGLNPAQQEAATRAVAQNRQELGKVTAPFAEVVTALKNAEAAAANMKEISPADVLKTRLPGGIGEGFMSEEAKALQKAQQSLTDLILRARSGAAITEGEAERLTNLYGVRPYRSINDYKKGLRELKSLMYAKLNAAQSGYAPTGDVDVDRYAALTDLEKGNPDFISYRDPFFKDVGGTGRREAIKPNAQTSDMVRMQKTVDGVVKYFQVPSANVEAAKARGYSEAK